MPPAPNPTSGQSAGTTSSSSSSSFRRVRSAASFIETDKLEKKAAENKISPFKAPRTLKGTLKTLLLTARIWLGSKGANGGLLSNGQVIGVTALQFFAWTQMARISEGIARVSRLPKGKVRACVRACAKLWVMRNQYAGIEDGKGAHGGGGCRRGLHLPGSVLEQGAGEWRAPELDRARRGEEGRRVRAVYV